MNETLSLTQLQGKLTSSRVQLTQIGELLDTMIELQNTGKYTHEQIQNVKFIFDGVAENVTELEQQMKERKAELFYKRYVTNKED